MIRLPILDLLYLQIGAIFNYNISQIKNNIKICIVEDEPLAISMLKNFIDKSKISNRIEIITDLDDFKKNLSKTVFFDILLMDLNLNGFKVIDFIHLVQKHSRFIIITTAYFPSDIQSMLNIDYSNILFLHKPFSYVTFLSTLNKALKKMEY